MDRRDFLGAASAAVSSVGILHGAPGETVSIGMIGVGGRGTYHLQNLLKMPNVKIVALCDTDAAHLENAAKLVEAAGQPRPAGFADWKKVLERKDVDAVVSALPVHLHAQCYLDTVAAGKDIYAEKPLCIDWTECDRVVDAVKKSKVIFQVGFQRRADPFFLETMELVHKGELGKLIEGRVAWCNAWGPLGGWFGHRKQSGDWMVEQACHNWDVIVWANQCQAVRAAGFGSTGWFKGRKVLVDGVKNTWIEEPTRDVHDYYAGVVEFENGVVVNIQHSWVVPPRFNEEYTRLIGVKGGIDFNAGVINYRKENGESGEPKPDIKITTGGKSESTVLAMQAFLKSVKERSKPIATVENGRDAVLCCLLMRKAVETKEVATMDRLKAERARS